MLSESAVTEVRKPVYLDKPRVIRHVLIDMSIICVSLVLAFAFANDFDFEVFTGRYALTHYVPVLVAALGILYWRKVYAVNPRFIGIYDFLNISFVGLLLGIASRLNEFRIAPTVSLAENWVAPILLCFFSTALLSGLRIFKRVTALRQIYASGKSHGKRVLIIGEGDAAETVFRELIKIGDGDYTVVGFVAVVSKAQGMSIHGVPVLGGTEDIPDIVERYSVEEILIALPEVKPSVLRAIFKICTKTEAKIRNLPSISALVDGSQRSPHFLKEIDVQDLLRRDSIQTDLSAGEAYVNGERVLITGGGGSIGSELARQVAGFSPASLTLLGKGEGSIFEIEQELKNAGGLVPQPVVCDVRDRQALGAIFNTHYPSVIFHAAAHKHVPLMESNPIEAIRNNVFGTLNVADAALKSGAKKFILVSTDKAVNPSNVMGATKRVAEMIVASLAKQGETEFSIVRFGNVLGSRGSLVPILKKQIAKGGPVTVTHPDMTRFFMTIPEAAELIIQAGALGHNGEIFVLDMGEPIKITDLVKDMIRMHGLVPGSDIEIKYIGIRPGEKIHEELYFDKEQVKWSGHEKIHLVANPTPITWEWLKVQMEELQKICDSGDAAAARTFLMELAWAKNLPIIAGHTAL